jgi:hypothetical protein
VILPKNLNISLFKKKTMSKTLRIIAVLLAVILVVLIFFYVSRDVMSPEEKVAEEWIETKPIVITETGVQKQATAAEWLAEIREYLLKDKRGQEIGYITYDELIEAKSTNRRPRTSKIPKSQLPPPPAPTPVPVPVPTPLPVPPNLTPGPTPIPPTPPPIPTPPPAPNITPPTPPSPPNITPTPTPVPTPTPIPTPSGPVCGNGMVEIGEQCEPPNTPTCDANCQIVVAPPQPPHCTDGQWNFDESDLDCGGSCLSCPPPGCPTCLSCWTNSDCITGNCDMSAAQPLPAIDPVTGAIYNTIAQVQPLAGQMWIIPWQGRCK